MKTLNDLTPEIRAKIPYYKSLAKDKLYCGEEHLTNKREDTVKYIEMIYSIANQKYKPVIVIADNPTSYKFMFRKLFQSKSGEKLIQRLFNLKNNTNLADSKLSSEIRSEIFSELDSELTSEIRSELGSDLHSELYSELYLELDSELNSELNSELDPELLSEIRSEIFSELDSELYSEIRSELDSELYSEIRSELDSELYSELNSELSSELDSELSSELDSELDSELSSELDSELDSELGPIKSHWLYLCNIYSRVYLTWHYFIHKELNLPTKKSKELCELFSLVNKTFILRCYFTKGCVLVLRTPNKILRNSIGLNNPYGPAVTFRGDYDMYYINGRSIQKHLFDKVSKQDITFSEFSQIKNEDEKSAVLGMMEQLWGENYVGNFIAESLTKIDTYIDRKPEQLLEGTTKGMNIGVYDLFSGEVAGNPVKYVRCYCPSTDRMFMLGVEDSHTSAKDAIASLYTIPKKLKNEIVEINRQGEVFSTILTKKGEDLVKKLTKDDLSDFTGISGEEYFEKIKFEY